MTTQTYSNLMKKQHEEFNNFPIAYAFDKKQLKDALIKLGAEKEECITYFQSGDILRKSDIPALKEMMKRHKEELLEAMKDEKFAEEAFLYEMNNHEYAINWSGDDDVLACFYMKEKDLQDRGLGWAYHRARKQHMKQAEEWGMI